MVVQPITAVAAAPRSDKPEKVVPPSPPRVIKDRTRGASYERVGFLGEGGFARVYEVKDANDRRRAVKVVHKANIKSKKNKTKLWAEIKLHQMMEHPNVVRFDDCFEDEENVYMMLELCDNGSLMDLLKRRKRYTEPEARVILVQLIAACQYMHQTNVIHRDLKLGNLFFDRHMNVKVGDFGLAALIENPGDRKKTICGTPNYIAPEVLFDTANGHSFEVDIWSVGVILYTLLIGRPPFQTKEIKAIYKRIRENRYEFPPDKEISGSAQELIMSILNPDPQKRPTLEAILRHRWFHDGPFPAYVPVTAYDIAPSFNNLTTAHWRRNFEAVCHKSRVGVAATIATDTGKMRADLGPSIIKQDKDFRYAVQPDSPVGALIQSARQPLVQAPAQIKEPTLLRKLSAAGAQATLSPVRRSVAATYRPATTSSSAPSSSARQMAAVGEEEEPESEEEEQPIKSGGAGGRYDLGVREREVATQKARLVSQMAANQAAGYESSGTDQNTQEREKEQRHAQYQEGGRQQRAPARQSPRRPLAPATTSAAANAGQPSISAPSRSSPTKLKGKGKSTDAGVPQSGGKRQPEVLKSLFEVVGRTLAGALKAAESEAGYLAPEEVIDAQAPAVFVVSWLDYCQKYGMGFAMCDGSISVHFNDSSNIAWAPRKQHFDYIHSANGVYQRSNHVIGAHPPDLHNKVYLLRHFEKYITQRLYGSQSFIQENHSLTTGMVFVKRYLRMKHVIVFRLSNEVVQFNFFDHTKLIISESGQVISFIDKAYELHTWSLEGLLREWKQQPSASRTERKRVEGLVYKLQYCVDVLVKIRTHGPNGQVQMNSSGDIHDAGPYKGHGQHEVVDGGRDFRDDRRVTRGMR